MTLFNGSSKLYHTPFCCAGMNARNKKTVVPLSRMQRRFVFSLQASLPHAWLKIFKLDLQEELV